MKTSRSRRSYWRFLPGCTLALLLILCGTSLTTSAGTPDEAARQHNQKGVEHFQAGFYGHAPKGQDQETIQEYAFAAAEFKNAINEDPTLVEPHRNLARLHFIQGRFAEAAEEYGTVTRLDPFDLDAYVNLALAQVELKNYQAAIDTLEQAKSRTTDEKARSTLNGYVEKVRKLQ